MGATGNLLLIQRLLTVSAFRLLRLIFTTVQSLYWRLNGTAQKLREARDPQNYERSAQVLDVVLFHNLCTSLNIYFNDFLCTHNRFEDPQYIIDNDHVTLMTLTDKNAIFGEAKEKNMQLWKSEFGLCILRAQMAFCNKLIIVPLHAFHRMAEKIGDPKAELILLFNTARSGSTLLTQVMEYTGRCVTLSEPDAPSIVTNKYKQHGDSPELRRLARDVLRCQCRPYESLQPPPLAYVLKVRGLSEAPALPFLRSVYPTNRCLFLYRDMVKTAKSLYRLSQPLPALRLRYLAEKFSAPFSEKIAGPNSLRFYRKEYPFPMPDDLLLGLMVNIKTMEMYLEMRKQGANIGAVRYEDLVARPLESCQRIMEFCGLPVSLAELAVKAFEVDSHRNSNISRSSIGNQKEPELSPKSREVSDKLLKSFGLPPIGEEIILEGTVTYQ